MKPQWQRRFLFRLSLALGYAHPDHLLRELDSRQVGEWMAFGMLEQVGHPVAPDPEEKAKAAALARRDKIEAGFRVLAEKQQEK